MSIHRIALFGVVFLVGYVAARYFPQGAKMAGMP